MANARIPLGTNSARNIDMSSAYSTFAAQGEASQWYTVTEVKGSNGGSRYKHKVKKARVFDEGGRGLFLVAQLSERWGSRQTPTGKTIWAEMPLSTKPSF